MEIEEVLVWISRTPSYGQGMSHQEIAQLDQVAMQMVNGPSYSANTTMEGCSFDTEVNTTPALAASRYPVAPVKGKGRGKGALVRQEESGKKKRTPPRKRQKPEEEVEREKPKETHQDGVETPETEDNTPQQHQEEDNESRRGEEDDDIMVIDQEMSDQILDEEIDGEIERSLRTYCRKNKERVWKLQRLLRIQCEKSIRDEETIQTLIEKNKILERELEQVRNGGQQGAASKGPTLKSAALYKQLLANAGLRVKRERD